MSALLLEANRAGYGIDQIRNTMTVRDLISFLEGFDGDTKIYISNDNGYTYGGITHNDFREEDCDEED